MNNCQALLRDELHRRRQRNSAYSLRAFARDLGVSVTALSDFMGGRRQFSKTNLERVFEALRLSPLEKIDFLETNRARRRLQPDEVERRQLAEDSFRLVSDWFSFAILSLARLKKNRADAAWIAKRLGISETEAASALERLVRMGLVEIEQGSLRRTSKSLTTSRDVPSVAIRKYHHGVLQKAQESLERDPVALRDFSAITFPTDPTRLKLAKDLLLRTKRKIAQLLEDEGSSDVYTLAYQLFPVTLAVKEEE